MAALNISVDESESHLIELEGLKGRAGRCKREESGTDVVNIARECRRLARHRAASSMWVSFEDEGP